MAQAPALLFISPAMPADRGNGLAMRMGVFLEAYARRFAVTLAVVPVNGPRAGEPTAFVRRHAERIVLLPLDRVMHPLLQLVGRHRDPEERRRALLAYPRPRPLFYDPIATRSMLLEQLDGQQFAIVHAGRSYMAPLVEPWFGKARCILDLDEDDARTLRRIGELRARNSAGAAEGEEAADADKFETLIGEYVPRFDLTVLANELELAGLRQRYPGSALALIANAIRPPVAAAPDSLAPFDFLMVGTLGYYPNADGALYFCREVLPLLPGATVTILGSRPPAVLQAQHGRAGVSIAADVPDVAPYYAAARAAIVPIRAGGGSRIKILEAFAHGVPVVSTAIGAEGLAVEDGRHLLIADSAGDFAAAARRLLQDGDLARRLVEGARALLAERYAFERIARRIEGLADGKTP